VPVKLPTVAEEQSLSAISATGLDDVWVAGLQTDQRYGTDGVGWNTMVAHWDGASWTVDSTPNRTIPANYQEGVVALSPTDVWAAGYSLDGSGMTETLLPHFDGQSWSIVPSPSPGNDYNVLWGIGTDGADGVWAVGSEPTSSFAVAHWDGARWSNVDAPRSSAPYGSWLADVVTLSPTDAWAVGVQNFGPKPHTALIEHWDGTSWSVAPAPPPSG
jgi:hypothetical protein